MRRTAFPAGSTGSAAARTTTASAQPGSRATSTTARRAVYRDSLVAREASAKREHAAAASARDGSRGAKTDDGAPMYVHVCVESGLRSRRTRDVEGLF